MTSFQPLLVPHLAVVCVAAADSAAMVAACPGYFLTLCLGSALRRVYRD
eukprot:CAMPEP_0168470716 /NCGR_PEP_ID=MMETSP0228-20121227/58884_1 /TAXON_ID=133427 /ORGANISM="Protoceratium reticulatum, Strain CCCM 535 (=CCMP 1889)" /LENGTH=48 /DNA_ID= /DNA_START= /DNA_END= /DNA_ORIENTATION=